MSFKRTTAVNKLLGLKKRKKVVQGGTSAGKTHGIIPILIDQAIKDKTPTKTTIVAETLPAVKEGALDIFKSVMMFTGRWFDSCWNASSLTYTFKSSKSRIQFKSFDTVGKAKSAGKRDRLFLNEANNIPFEIADALMIRSKETWIDFNPDAEFWVHTEVLPEENSEFLLLTYEDNEACPPETLEDLKIKISKAFWDVGVDWNDPNNVKSEYWANWCRVYVKGEIGSLQGVVFSNWKIIDSLPEQARYVKSGTDFGFTNDPTTCIDKYIYNGQKIFDEALYQKGLVNSEIASILKQDGLKRTIIADSAEPKTIAELNRFGLRVLPATKGADSVTFGIQALQEEPFLVTARSLNLIQELRKYSWQKDKSGATNNVPIDAFNHCIDPMRYIEMDGRTKGNVKLLTPKVI